MSRPPEAVLPAVQPGARVLLLCRDGATPPALAALLAERAGPPRSPCSSTSAARGTRPGPYPAGAPDPGPFADLCVAALAASPTPPGACCRGARAARRRVRDRRPADPARTQGAGPGRARPGPRPAALGRRGGQRQHRHRVDARRAAAGRSRSRPGPTGPTADATRPGWACRAWRWSRGRPRRAGRPAGPDAVFVGGGVTAEGVLETCWAALRRGGRLVAHAVTVESEAVLQQWQRAEGGELVKLASATAPLGGFTTWRPALPVTQWQVTGAELRAADDRLLRRRRAGRARPADGPGPAADRGRAGGAVRGQPGPGRGAGRRPPGARLVDTAELDLDTITAELVGARGRPGRGAAAQRRPVDLQRGGRADPAAGRRGRAVAGGARRARVRRRGRRAAAGADPARRRPDRGADPDRGPGDADAARRGPGRLAATGCTLVLHLAVQNIDRVAADLLPHYGADCPAAVVARASWPDEEVLRCDLGELAARVRGGHPPDRDHRGRPGARGRRLQGQPPVLGRAGPRGGGGGGGGGGNAGRRAESNKQGGGRWDAPSSASARAIPSTSPCRRSTR